MTTADAAIDPAQTRGGVQMRGPPTGRTALIKPKDQQPITTTDC